LVILILEKEAFLNNIIKLSQKIKSLINL